MADQTGSGDTNRGRRLIAIGFVAGGGLIAIGLFFVVWTLFGQLSGPRLRTPGGITADLGTGEWYLYELVGERRAYGPVTVTSMGAPALGPGDVQVVDPAGGHVEVHEVSGNFTLAANEDEYLAVARFEVDDPGPHSIVAHDVGETEVLVARGFFDLLRLLAPWLVAGSFGLLLSGAATVGAVIRASRRRGARALLPPPPAPFPPPPS